MGLPCDGALAANIDSMFDIRVVDMVLSYPYLLTGLFPCCTNSLEIKHAFHIRKAIILTISAVSRYHWRTHSLVPFNQDGPNVIRDLKQSDMNGKTQTKVYLSSVTLYP